MLRTLIESQSQAVESEFWFLLLHNVNSVSVNFLQHEKSSVLGDPARIKSTCSTMVQIQNNKEIPITTGDLTSLTHKSRANSWQFRTIKNVCLHACMLALELDSLFINRCCCLLTFLYNILLSQQSKMFGNPSLVEYCFPVDQTFRQL